MYVAKRAFRNYNQMILPGSTVEPGNIKWFKTRLKDKVIIEVDAYNFNQWNEYFKTKYGVELTPIETVDTEETVNTEEIVSTEANAEVEKPKMVTVQI